MCYLLAAKQKRTRSVPSHGAAAAVRLSKLQRFTVAVAESSANPPCTSKLQRFSAPEASAGSESSESSESSSSGKTLGAGVSETSGTDSGSDIDRVVANLATSSTAAMLHPDNKAVVETTAMANGKSVDRIKSLLRKKICPCNCQKQVTLKSVADACSTFWGLKKASQDAMLWSIACSTHRHSSSNRVRRQWQLDGTCVCRRAFLKLMGMGNHRLSRCMGTFQGMDGRRHNGQGNSARTVEVDQFLREAYFSMAETLPHRLVNVFGGVL